MGVSIDHIPSGSRTTDAGSAEKERTQPPPSGNGSAYGTQPPLAPASEFGTQPPLAPASEFGTQPPPTSDRRLKRKVESLYGTQPPPPSDARLKRDLRRL